MVGKRSRVQISTRWTAEKRTRFLDALAQTGNVRLASRAAGTTSASSVYRIRRADPAFAAEWDQAIAEAVARLESTLVAHALAAIEAHGAALEAEGAAATFDFGQAMQLLKYYQAGPNERRRGGSPPRYATREETDAALNKALDAHAARIRERKKREAAARRALRQAGGGQEGAAKGAR